MTPEEVVDEFIRRICTMDLDAACELVTDDCEYDNVPMAKVHGPAGIREVLAPFLGGCEEIDWVVHHQVEQGDVVMNERVDRFERADGTWLELPVAGVFEVVDGKIALWRDYFDLGSFQRQLQG